MIARGTAQLREDFNFRNIMDRVRLSRYETKKLADAGSIDYTNYNKDYIVKIRETMKMEQQKFK